MSVLVGIDPARTNVAAIELGAALGTALDREVKVAVVVVVAPGVARPLRTGMTDEEFAELLASDAIAEAKARLGDRFGGVIPVIERSVRAGLLAAVERERPGHLVLGSVAGTPVDAIGLGDTARGILNSSPTAVVLTPAGYRRADPDHPLRRVTVAFGPDAESVFALRYAALLAERADTQLRTATFWVRQSNTQPTPGGPKYHAEIAAQWKEQMEARLDKAVRGLDDLDLPTRFIHRDMADGDDWATAVSVVEWGPGDLLIVGSSPPTGLRSVFLGSRAAEILRRSPVPVAVLPPTD